jgi:hypothetical protein
MDELLVHDFMATSIIRDLLALSRKAKGAALEEAREAAGKLAGPARWTKSAKPKMSMKPTTRSA